MRGLFAVWLGVLVFAPSAGADHSITDWVSHPADGSAIGADGHALVEGTTPSGSHAVFSTPDKLVDEDNDGAGDLYRWANGVITWVSPPTGVPESGSVGPNFRAISSDGSKVFFQTTQRLTVDDTDSGGADVYMHSGGVTTLISKPTDPAVAVPTGTFVFMEMDAISADGTHVFYETNQQLAANDTDAQTDVYEWTGGQTRLASVAAADGVDAGAQQASYKGNSSDGTKVWFDAGDRLVGSDNDGAGYDVYERSNGITTTLISAPGAGGTETADNSLWAGATPDGSHVFFHTSQELVAEDDDESFRDVYRRTGGVTTLVSEPGTGADLANDRHATFKRASQDGSRVFFETEQKLVTADVEEAPIKMDVYERSGGSTSIVSDTEEPGTDTAGVTLVGASASGDRVFLSTIQRLAAEDGDTHIDIFESGGGDISLVSRPGAGATQATSNHVHWGGSSADGARVFFISDDRMTADDADSTIDGRDLFERYAGETYRISRASGVSEPSTGNASPGVGVSTDGRRVFYDSGARLVPGDTDDSKRDIYLARLPDPPPPEDPPAGDDTPAGGSPSGGSDGSPAGSSTPATPDAIPFLPPGPNPGACSNEASGTPAGDVLRGSAAGDLIRGLAGNDTLSGLAGDDCLFGDAGNDKLSGGDGNDQLDGGAGKDKLDGGRGKNKLTGGAGNDVIVARNGAVDKVNCGGGRDTVRADKKDKLRSCEKRRR